MRYDWLLTGAILVAALWSFWYLARDLSDRLARHWARFLARPVWFRAVASALLIWMGLRLLRAGPRAFLVGLLVVGGLLLWAEAALRSRRS